MAVFKIIIRSKEIKSVVPVYISISHNGKVEYMRTQFLTNKKGVKEIINRKGGVSFELKDPFILKKCLELIDKYSDRCNRTNISLMTCSELYKFLKQDNDFLSFTDYVGSYIQKMAKEGRESTAKRYRDAINSLLNFSSNKEFSFADVTTKLINEWIESLSYTKRAKNMYPTYVKQMFYSGMEFYNDYDRDIILVKNDPFRRIKIPKEDIPEKRGVGRDVIISFLNAEVPEIVNVRGKLMISRERLGIDVAMMIICLAGINAADLYVMKNENYMDGKLCYRRQKTKNRRADDAYIEIKVPDIIKPYFEKYRGNDNLFCFSERYSSMESFTNFVNKGMRAICKKNNLESVSTYTFRHSWATIACNECGASMEEVSFALNHSSKYKVTERYVRKDYSKVDVLNRKVIEFIFKDGLS